MAATSVVVHRLWAPCLGVEAGLYVTAGTKVTLIVDGKSEAVKASELSGLAGMLFRRNSQTGAVEAIARDGVGIELNSELHA